MTTYDDDEQISRAQEEAATRRSRLDYSQLVLPDAMRDAVVAREHDDTPAVLATRQWFPAPSRPILVLAGPPGTGKTVAAATALAAKRGAFVRIRAFEALSRASFGEEAESFRALLAHDLIVLDDLGREQDPHRLAVVLDDLIDDRCGGGRRTIITTNLDPRALADRYADPRLASRLSQLAHYVPCTGPDLRRIDAAELTAGQRDARPTDMGLR